jgi:hypothetical protein
VEYHGEREIRGWKQPRNPPMSTSGVSVAIVLGTRESRVHGEGPQLIGSLVCAMKPVSGMGGNPLGVYRHPMSRWG